MNEEQTLKEVEISLVDLLFYCLERWRIVMIFMVLFGILAGGYKYLNTVRENQVKQQKIADMKVREEEKDGREEMSEKGQEVYEIDREAIASYEQAVAESEAALERQEAYLKQTVIMEIDPYCVSTGTLQYHLDGGERTDVLVSAYQTYVADGVLAKELHQADPEVSVEDLRYLMSFTYDTDITYKMDGDQMIREVLPREALFKFQIKMPDEDLRDAYLEQAQKCMADHAEKLQTELAEHELTLLSLAQSETTDLNLRDYQNTLQSTHIAAVKSLQALKAEQDALLMAGEEELPEGDDQTEEEENGETEIVLADPASSAVKYAVLGAVMGAFLVCFAFLLCYIMNGRLQNMESFQMLFEIPVLSFVYVPQKRGKFFGFVDRWIYRARCGVYAKMSFEEQMRMTLLSVRAAVERISVKEEKKRVMLAGTIPESETAGLCGKFSSEIQGVSFSGYRQIPAQPLTLGELEDYDAAIFLEKRGVSYSKLILQERNLAAAGKVTVLGAVVLA